MRKKVSTLSIESDDVGMTQVATVYVGNRPIISFYTQTKHEDYSLSMAEDLVASALRPLLEAKMTEFKYREANL